MNGAQLTKLVIAEIEKAGGKAINLIAASKSGNADIIACINGRYCEFEIKGKGDTEKPHQAAKLNETIIAGGVAGFVHSLADAQALILLAKTGKACPPIKLKVRSITL
jgi:hypothetical protein